MSAPELPAMAEISEDVLLARVDQLEQQLAQAEPDYLRELRDRAEAYRAFARRKKLRRLGFSIARFTLLTEARLGALCPPRNDKANLSRGNSPGPALDPGSSPIDEVEPDKSLRYQYRRVYEARDFIETYCEEKRKDDEEPNREGLCSFAERALRAVIAANQPSDEDEVDEKPAKKRDLLPPAPRGRDGKGIAPPLAKIEGADWTPAWPKEVPLAPVLPTEQVLRQVSLKHPVLRRLLPTLAAVESWTKDLLEEIPAGAWEARVLKKLPELLTAATGAAREAAKHAIEVERGGGSRLG